ncbi:MAG TPA: MBG domain-containing protein [Planctomycetota bacterium]|nr:MBG domain-containing protein [Planctomycetota bacterium]
MFRPAFCLSIFIASIHLFAAQSVLTQHNDNQRTGANTAETILTPATVTTAKFGKIFTRSMDANVNGQILYVPGVTINGAVHNVLYCVTSTNNNGGASSFYAFDADDPTQSLPLLHTQLIVSARWSTPAPVIDPANKIIYFVNKETTDSGNSKLHAFDITTGVEKTGSPVTIAVTVPGTGDGSVGGNLTFNTAQHNCRAALLFANSSVYVAFSHNSDSFPYHGWVFKYTYTGNGFSQDAVFCTSPNGGLGGIWQTGKGVMADTSGNIYFTTGNGVFNQSTNPPSYGMCFMKLSPTLQVLDYFAPSNELSFSNADQDVGNTGVLMIPGTNRLVCGGTKYGYLHMVDSSNMGHIGATPSSPDTCLQTITGLSSNIRQNVVAWNGGASGTFVYLWGSGQKPTAYLYSTQTVPAGQLTVSSTNANYTANGGALAVTSNGTSSGILWAIENNDGASNNVFHAFDATNLATELWNSNQNSARDSFGGTVGKWQFPTIVNGKAYIGTGASTLVAYGVFDSPPTITNVSPNSGPSAGGTGITVTGTNYSVGTSVKIGGNTCTNVVVTSATTLTCNTPASTPAGTQGAFNVVVTNTGGNATLTSGFTYSDAPSSTTTAASNTQDTYNGSSHTIPLTATVTATGSTVNEGTVTFQIQNGGTNIGTAVTSPIVVNGAASVNYTLPGGVAVGAYVIQANFNGSTHYAASSDGTHTLLIGKATLTVSADSLNRNYGAANPTLTGALIGVQPGDSITVSYTTSATATSPIGNYTIVPTLSDPGNRLNNYTVSSTNGTLTINAAPLVVTPDNFSRAYGSANPSLTGTVIGIQNGDNISATFASNANTTSIVGAYSITSTLQDPQNKLSNYAVTQNSGTLTVTQAPLTVTAANAGRTYGTANPTFTGSIVGIQNNDAISATYSTTADNTSAVGQYPITPAVVDPNNRLPNYNVTVNNGTLTISNAPPITATGADISKVYGADNPVFTGTLTGVLNGDNITASFASTATNATQVGNYSIVPTLNDPDNKLGNYSVIINNGTLSITPAPLTVTPASLTRIFNAPNPTLTGTLAGLQNNDAITASYFTAAEQRSTVGAYPIMATLNDPNSLLGNYTVTIAPANLTIAKATPTIVWPQPLAIVAGMPLSATQLDAVAQDPTTTVAIAGTFTYAPLSGTVLAAGPAQPLSVSFVPNDSSNYSSANAGTTIEVDPATAPLITSALTATANVNAAFTYTITSDGTNPQTFAAAGLPAGLALVGATISGKPAATGLFNVTLTASNFAGTDSKLLKLTVIGTGTNHAPVIAVPLTVSANPATVNTPVTFTANATDADGDALDYNWNFGDGTVAAGASVTKTFSTANLFTVQVSVSDGQAVSTQSVNVVVSNQGNPIVFAVTKLKLQFNFARSNADSLSFSGSVGLAPGFTPFGKNVSVLIGGLSKQYVLSAKGISADKAFTLKLNPKGGPAKFSVVLKNQNLFTPLQTLGFSKTSSNPDVSFPVIVSIDGTPVIDTSTLNYSVRIGPKGPLSGKAQK